MKSDLDLTEHNDFNSNKFLPAKVKRNYYDLDNYARRVPWSKDGEVLSSAKFINFTPDWDYLSSTTTYDLDNNLFITNTDPDISNGLMLMHNTSNVSSMRAWISNQTTTKYTYLYPENDGYRYIWYISGGDKIQTSKIANLDMSCNCGFFTGKVEDIRRNKAYLPNYNFTLYNNRKNDFKSRDYYMKYTSLNYTGPMDKSVFKNDYNRESYNYVEEYRLYRSKNSLLSRFSKERPHDFDENLISYNYEDDRKIRKVEWFDRHQYYLQELVGRRPLDEWRGITELKLEKRKATSVIDSITNGINQLINWTPLL